MNLTESCTPTPPLPESLTANLSDEHTERVARIVRRVHRPLSAEAKTLFVLGALCADGSAQAARVALADPAVLAVAQRIIGESVAR